MHLTDAPVEVLRGARGTLRWGYHDAGELWAWTISVHKRTRVTTLRAQVKAVDPWKSRQRPLTFVVLLKGGRAWEWPLERVELSPGVLVATLGAKLIADRGIVHGT